MGCLTGFYLILKGNRQPKEIHDLLYRAFRYAEAADSVPGATAVNCGNFELHNLAIAKWHAAKFADYLAANKDNTAIFEYPKSERLVTDDGQQFFDS
jgi:S-ribosylhomocysteine lyase